MQGMLDSIQKININDLSWSLFAQRIALYFSEQDAAKIFELSPDLKKSSDIDLNTVQQEICAFKYIDGAIVPHLQELDRTVTGKIFKKKPKVTPKKIIENKDAITLYNADEKTDDAMTGDGIQKNTTDINKKSNDDQMSENDNDSMVITDSEDNDSDVDSVDFAERTPIGKKNRRGQRARQAIWEKKFGTNAKHLEIKKQKRTLELEKAAKERKEGAARDAKNKMDGLARTNVIKKVDDESLHPSWLAKKNNRVGITEFAGKKIVFGQDEETAPPITEAWRLRIKEKKENAKEEPKEVLHPSWEAKRRAKEMEAERMRNEKPTKVVFDD